MNPLTFYGSIVEEDPQGFIDEIFKVLDAMGVSNQEKAELAANQLEDIDQVWYEQWKDEMPLIEDRIIWGALKTSFLDILFPFELRD